jgi:branched-chain amino acid transport system permease protein
VSAKASGYFSRSYADDLSLAPTRLRRVMLAAFAVVAVGYPNLVDAQYLDLTNQAAIAIVGALGLNILTGYAGQLSLAHAGLIGLAGFASGILATNHGVPFPLVLLSVAGLGAVIGLVLGLPSLRLRGLYLVLATLAFHFVAVLIMSWYQTRQTGVIAISGLSLPHPEIGPLTVDSIEKWYYVLLVIVVATVVLSINLLRSRPGRAWIALRDRELVAEALGVNLLGYKLLAFVLSSVLAAVAGALLVYYNGSVVAEAYTLNLAVTYLVIVIIGGLGSTTGTILGALFITMSPRILTFWLESLGASSNFQSTYLIPLQVVLFGCLMAGFLLFEPRGLIGVWERLRTYVELWPLSRRPFAERQR